MTHDKQHPPPLRKAATIILVQEKSSGLEVYLLRRSKKSGFMGGLYVFPGGVVAPEDFGINAWRPHIDMAADRIEAQLGGEQLSREDILGFSIAAIRETLEESGVLLASGSNKTQKDLDDISAYRMAEGLPAGWFRTRMMEENWVLSLSSLGRWSHWVTPELMKKRFDTRFFIVFMPDNQTCMPDNMETKHGIWLSPLKALEQNLDARVPLSPPAIVTLTQLLKFNTLTRLRQEIQTRSWGKPIAPRLVPSSNGPVILEPWDDMFETKDGIDTSTVSKKLLPPGSEFSRLWCDNGVWKPVGL